MLSALLILRFPLAFPLRGSAGRVARAIANQTLAPLTPYAKPESSQVQISLERKPMEIAGTQWPRKKARIIVCTKLFQLNGIMKCYPSPSRQSAECQVDRLAK